MTYGGGYRQQDQYPQQGSGQQWPPQSGQQGGPWQRQAYDPAAYHRRMQRPPQESAWEQQGYGQQHPPRDQQWQQPGPREQQGSWQERGQYQNPQPHRHERSRVPLYAGIAAVVVIAGGGAAYALTRHGTPASAGSPADSASSAAAAQPDTAAGVRAAAQQFYALYTAGQWGAAWADLAPAAQSAVPVATWTAVHDGCPSPSAGMARVIKSVTLAGTTAVVTETIAGSLGSIGAASDAWTYSGGRWGFSPSASSMSIYTHGSVNADIAAAKAAGECGS